MSPLEAFPITGVAASASDRDGEEGGAPVVAAGSASSLSDSTKCGTVPLKESPFFGPDLAKRLERRSLAIFVEADMPVAPPPPSACWDRLLLLWEDDLLLLSEEEDGVDPTGVPSEMEGEEPPGEPWPEEPEEAPFSIEVKRSFSTSADFGWESSSWIRPPSFGALCGFNLRFIRSAKRGHCRSCPSSLLSPICTASLPCKDSHSPNAVRPICLNILDADIYVK